MRFTNKVRAGAVGLPLRFKFSAAVYATLTSVSIKYEQIDATTPTPVTVSATAEPATNSYVGYTNATALVEGKYVANIWITSGSYTGPADKAIAFEVIDTYAAEN